MNKIRKHLSVALVLLLVAAMLMTTACGQKPEPDTSNPVQSGDVSTDVSGDATGDDAGDATDDTTTGTDDVSGDSTDEVSGDTTADVSGDAAGSTTGNKTSGNQTTGNKTTGKTDGKTSTTTKNPGAGILNTTTTKKTEKTNATTSTTTAHVTNPEVKDQIMSLFTPAMKGKTATVLSAWDQGTDEKAKMDEVTAATGLKVKWNVAQGDQYGTRLSALINASASPDLAMLGEGNFPSFVIKNYYSDLSVSSVNFDGMTDIFDVDLMNSFKWNGKRYAVMVKNSENSNMCTLFYNKTMFKKLGVTDPGTLWKQGKWNWDTFLECAQKTVDLDNNIVGCDFYNHYLFLASSGVGVVTVGDGTITNNLEHPDLQEAWTFINKLYHEYKVTTSVVGSDTNFASGNAAMMLGSSWQANAGGTIANNMKDDWGIVPYPTKPGLGDRTLIDCRGGAIPIGAKNPDAAVALWVYWVSYDTGMLGSGKAESDTGAYSRDEINDVKRAMWAAKKVPNMTEGVLTYGGEYDQWAFSWDIFQAGMSGISTNVGKWKSALDVNIKRIMTEFS